jgi:hypothetical protein
MAETTEPGTIRAHMPSSGLSKADSPRRYKSELSAFRRWFRNRMRSNGKPFPAGPSPGWSEVQHRYHGFWQSPNRASLVDCSYPEIMGCSMGHVGITATDCYTSRRSSHRDPRFHEITDEATGPAGLARGEALLEDSPSPPTHNRSTTAWLIRNTRHGAERRDGQRQAQPTIPSTRNAWNATVARDHQQSR